MLIILKKVVSIFIIIGIGFCIRRLKVLPENASSVISDYLIKISCPCLILSSTATYTVTDTLFKSTVETIVLSLVLFALAPIVGWFVAKYILRVKDTDDLGIYTFGFGSTNSGFFGFPITLATFGTSILYIVIIQNAILSVYVYGFGLIAMEIISSKGKFSIKEFAPALKNVCLISSIIAIVVLFCDWQYPPIVLETLDLIGTSTTPLSMVLVGIMLGNCDFKAVFANYKFVLVCALKVILLPVLTFLIVNWLPVDATVKVGLIFSFAFPAAVMTVPVAARFNFDAEKAAQIIAFTSLISMITLPVIASFLTSYYEF